MAIADIYSQLVSIVDGVTSPYAINNVFTGQVFFNNDNLLTDQCGTTVNGENVIEFWEVYCTAQRNFQRSTQHNAQAYDFTIQGFMSWNLLADFDGANNNSEVVFGGKVEGIIQTLGKSGNFTLGGNIDLRDISDRATMGLAKIGNKLMHTAQINLTGMEASFVE